MTSKSCLSFSEANQRTPENKFNNGQCLIYFKKSCLPPQLAKSNPIFAIH